MICNTWVVFIVLVKWIRNRSIYVYSCKDFLISLGKFLLKRNYTILELLFVGMLAFTDEESFQLKIIYSAISKCINSDILQKLPRKFLLFAKLKKMLYSWEEFAIREKIGAL